MLILNIKISALQINLYFLFFYLIMNNLFFHQKSKIKIIIDLVYKDERDK